MAKGKKKKMKVYLESTISGYATARPTSDERAAAMQTKTLQWVERWMKKCDCYVSKYVVDENLKGDKEAAKRRIEFDRKAKMIEVDDSQVVELAKRFISPDAIPSSQFTDALHVAVATVYGMDVLLTWNCTHINNPITLPVVYSEIARAGYKPPKILDARQFMEAYDEH